MVQLNIICPLTMTHDTDPDDLPDLQPSEMILEFLDSKPPIIQSNLHPFFSNNGNLAYAEATACTALKHGFLTSNPSPNAVNGDLCLFLYPHESYVATLSAAKLMQLTEKFGPDCKYKKEDLVLLTDVKISLPKTFDAYLHMLQNIHFLTQLLDGDSCVSATAWLKAIDHARQFERLY